MQIVKAALEGFANRYAALGLRIGETEARALVIAVVRDEKPRPMPTEQELDELARSLVRRINDLAKQRV